MEICLFYLVLGIIIFGSFIFDIWYRFDIFLKKDILSQYFLFFYLLILPDASMVTFTNIYFSYCKTTVIDAESSIPGTISIQGCTFTYSSGDDLNNGDVVAVIGPTTVNVVDSVFAYNKGGFLLTYANLHMSNCQYLVCFRFVGLDSYCFVE